METMVPDSITSEPARERKQRASKRARGRKDEPSMRPARANEPCMQNAQCHEKMHYKQQKYYRGCEDSNRRSPASGHAGQAKHGWYGAIVTKQLRQKQRNSVALALQSHELILEHRTRFMMCTGDRTIVVSKPTLMGLEHIIKFQNYIGISMLYRWYFATPILPLPTED